MSTGNEPRHEMGTRFGFDFESELRPMDVYRLAAAFSCRANPDFGYYDDRLFAGRCTIDGVELSVLCHRSLGDQIVLSLRRGQLPVAVLRRLSDEAESLIRNAGLEGSYTGTYVQMRPVTVVTPQMERDTLAVALPPGLTKEALVTYLRGCPVALSARTRVPDTMNPDGPAIPLAFYSDGAHVWSAETVAYVDRYNAGLPHDFLRHVEAHVTRFGDQPPEVNAEQLRRATKFLKEESRAFDHHL